VAYKKIPNKVCAYCEELYIGTKLQKYCGQECSKKAREIKKEIKCLNCNKLFIVQSYRDAKYCSKVCKIKFNSSKIIEVNCKNCKQTFLSKECKKKKFCTTTCFNKYNCGINHYEWKTLNHIVHENSALKKWAVIVKKRDNYTCQLCEETNTKVLEAHHIKEKENYPDLKFDISNGITLCCKCHYLQHLSNTKALRLIGYKIKKLYI
jgi:hypothetical protein